MKRYTIKELEELAQKCQWCGGTKPADCYGDATRKEPCWHQFIQSNLKAERILQKANQ